MAANPISFTEIDAYCRLNRLSMSPWELGLIRQLDAVALAPPAKGSARPPSASSVGEAQPASPDEVAEAKQIVRGLAKDRRVVKRQPKPKQDA
jgi:hypothetical protein